MLNNFMETFCQTSLKIIVYKSVCLLLTGKYTLINGEK